MLKRSGMQVMGLHLLISGHADTARNEIGLCRCDSKILNQSKDTNISFRKRKLVKILKNQLIM